MTEEMIAIAWIWYVDRSDMAERLTVAIIKSVLVRSQESFYHEKITGTIK